MPLRLLQVSLGLDLPAGQLRDPFTACLYEHDLPIIGLRLFATAVGQTAIAPNQQDGRFEQQSKVTMRGGRHFRSSRRA